MAVYYIILIYLQWSIFYCVKVCTQYLIYVTIVAFGIFELSLYWVIGNDEAIFADGFCSDDALGCEFVGVKGYCCVK